MHSAYMNHRPTVDAQAVAVGKGTRSAPMVTANYIQCANAWSHKHPSPFRKLAVHAEIHEARNKAMVAWRMIQAGKMSKESEALFRQRYHTYFEQFELR